MGNTISRHQRYISDLIKIAAAQDGAANSKIAACLVIYNKVVSYGFNSYKTHPMQAMFSTHDEAIHLHAEICAIKNALRTIDQAELSKATLYVARAKYDGCARAKVIQGMAKPCCGCSRALNHYGISRIMYTLDNGDIAIST